MSGEPAASGRRAPAGLCAGAWGPRALGAWYSTDPLIMCRTSRRAPRGARPARRKELPREQDYNGPDAGDEGSAPGRPRGSRRMIRRRPAFPARPAPVRCPAAGGDLGAAAGIITTRWRRRAKTITTTCGRLSAVESSKMSAGLRRRALARRVRPRAACCLVDARSGATCFSADKAPGATPNYAVSAAIIRGPPAEQLPSYASRDQEPGGEQEIFRHGLAGGGRADRRGPWMKNAAACSGAAVNIRARSSTGQLTCSLSSCQEVQRFFASATVPRRHPHRWHVPRGPHAKIRRRDQAAAAAPPDPCRAAAASLRRPPRGRSSPSPTMTRRATCSASS